MEPTRIGLPAKLAVSAAALVVGLVLCELAARVIYPAPPTRTREPKVRYQPDADLGFFHVPSQTGWLDDGLATINALGLRGRLPAVPKPVDAVRILAIGDSTTFGWGVGDDETYCAVLERQLGVAVPARPIEVVNGGVVSYDLNKSARLLRRFASELDPDLVLVGFYWNDLPFDQGPPDGPGLGPPGQSAPGPPAPGSFVIGQPSRLNRVLRTSRLLYVLRHGWLASLDKTEAASHQVRWEMALLEGRQSGAIDEAWQTITATLSDIRSIAEARGFGVGVVILPIRAQVETHYPRAQYQARVRAIAESLGLFVVDPLPYFMAHADPEALFIPYDRMHFSAQGNAELARAVFDALKERPEIARAIHTVRREVR
jgi:lysophospholipase L1-like esterase